MDLPPRVKNRTLTDVTTRIAMIRLLDETHDYEAAHAEEDELLHDYIRDIAEGCCDDMVAKANLIVEALDKSQTRWYA